MSQKEQIKQLLENREWICGTIFLSSFIPEYRSRINELRRAGIVVEARKCQTHLHASRTLQEWRIVPEVSQTLQTTPKQEKSASFTPNFDTLHPLFAEIVQQQLFN